MSQLFVPEYFEWFCLIANDLMILLALSGIGTPERVGRGKNRLE